MELKVISNLSDPRIIEYLQKDPGATVYHHPLWINAISDIYNYPAYYLIYENKNNKNIAGLFPFVIKPGRFAKKIICLPSTTHCDPLFPADFDYNLIPSTIEKHFNNHFDFDFKFRNELPFTNFAKTSGYYLHTIQLGSNLDETYNALGRRSIKRFIKKAEEFGLTLRFGESEADLKIFYNLEVKLRKSIGLPPAPYNFFYLIWAYMKKDNLTLLPIIEYNNIPVASSLILKYKNTFHFEYTAIDKKYIDYYPNHKLHWDIIKLAQTDYNAKYIDMGRTEMNNSNLIYFKEKWNAKGTPLYRLTFPHKQNSSIKSSALYNSIRKINMYLPEEILRLEGNLLFRFFE